MQIEAVARICHEANRAYALASGENPAQIHPSWDDAPEEIRASAVEDVRHALAGESPEQLHSSWMMSKRNAGWTYGPTRDNALKVHPCLVPYDQLPEAQQRKDALFLGIVEACAGPLR